ncbi:DUF3025 domain-containing protein [Alteromonas sp. CYL-A6]|uniref:DUF3025 domain-containing protein n=1 Tax=Alteromonas nitratireducens TaxID=3390813 RepID=UPI0034B4DD7D
MVSATRIWHPETLRQSAAPPVITLLDEMTLSTSSTFPSPQQLSRLAAQQHHGKWCGPEFVGQARLGDDETRYYETIIAEDGVVPTREDNWHDLFNALIWIQFPKTKALLNQLHREDILHHGLHPRTARRNHITHFDECGVVLAVPQQHVDEASQILYLLDQHCWSEAFLEAGNAWGRVLLPVVFGHANLEMMLNPFIGLTGKWLAVTVPDNYIVASAAAKRAMLDDALTTRIASLDYLQHRNTLKPLPLLGVPGWYQSQSPAFYRNTDYFRPRNPALPVTRQLPLP